MQTKLFIISFLIISLLNFSESKVRSDVERTVCTKAMKTSFINFYKKNVIKYNLLSLPEEFSEENCFFLNVKDGSMNKVVLFMDVITTSPNNKDQLIISQWDPSRGFEFETNISLDVMQDSYNAFFLKQESHSQRNKEYFQILIRSLVNSVDENEYSELFSFFKLSYMLGFENPIKSVYLNIADKIVHSEMDYYLKTFKTDMLNGFVEIADEIQSILDVKFKKIIMDIDSQEEIEHITEHDPNELLNLFKFLIGILKKLSTNQGLFGRSDLSKNANKSLNQIDGTKLIHFLSDFHRKIDKSKPSDWIHASSQNDLNDLSVKQNLIHEMEEIKEFEFQYYMIEYFAMIGIKILSSTDKKAGMVEMIFSSSDKCLLTDFELDEMIQFAISHKWVLPTTISSNTRKILRACSKIVDENLETFVFKINPTGKSRCEIVIQRTDSIQDGSVLRELTVIPDTHDYYTYGNSCLRDTNRQRGINVENPLSYYRNLL